MSYRQCPECAGKGRCVEPMDKFERAEYGSLRTIAWESRCSCCRGRGYILFDKTYPTAAEFRSAYRDWVTTEIIPEMEAHKKRMEDSAFIEELKRANMENLKRTTTQRTALVARLGKAVQEAIAKVERME